MTQSVLSSLLILLLLIIEVVVISFPSKDVTCHIHELVFPWAAYIFPIYSFVKNMWLTF